MDIFVKNENNLKMDEETSKIHETAEDKEVVKRGLKSGRELNSTLILTFGDSGTGKSTTLNKILNKPFQIDTPCKPTGSNEMILQKLETFTDVSHPMITSYHCFLNTPLLLTDVKDLELLDASLERKFVKNKSLLQNIHSPLEFLPTELPIVLFFVSADTKLQGTNTRMAKSFKLLKASKLIQPQGQNLIIVVTRSLQLITEVNEDDDEETNDDELAKESFRRNYEDVKQAIFEATRHILGISQVPIAFIENKAMKVLRKYPDSDFYELPNGEISHYNVLKAIFNCKNAVKQPADEEEIEVQSCVVATEENETFEIIEEPSVKNDPSQFETTESYTEAGTEGLLKFPIEFLGHGICHRCGTIKQARLLTDEYYTLPISSNKTLVPCGVQARPEKTSCTNSFTFTSPANFNAKLVKQGLNHPTLHVIKALSKTLELDRLAQLEFEIMNSDSIYFFYQRDRCTNIFEIENGGTNAYLNCPSFGENFQILMNGIEDESICHNFFGKWGTHFVTQQGIGGTIYVLCSLKNTVTAQDQGDIEALIDSLLAAIMSSSPPAYITDIISCIRKKGITKEKILVLGDVSDCNILTFEELTTTILDRWNESVNDDPINVTSYTKTCAYYDLVKKHEQKKTRLETATSDYVNKQCLLTHFGVAPLGHQSILIETEETESTNSTKNANGTKTKRLGLRDFFSCNIL